MKLLFAFITPILLLLATNQTCASEDAKIAVVYNHFKMGPESTNMWGLNFELFATDNLSLNYSLLLGFNSNNFYAHTHAGMAGGLYLISANLYDEYDDNDASAFFRFLGVLLLFIPEGVNYHVPMEGSEIELVPYFNPLGYDYIAGDYSVSSGLGMKVLYNLPAGFSLSPFAGFRYPYKIGQMIYDAGIALEYRL